MASVLEADMHLAGECALGYSFLQKLCQRHGFVSADCTFAGTVSSPRTCLLQECYSELCTGGSKRPGLAFRVSGNLFWGQRKRT